jgi:beta-lactamase class A
MLPLLFFFLAGSPGLPEQFAALAPDAQGRVGVSAMLIETGESFQFQGSDRYPMQSVYKFPIAMAVLREVDRGALRLDQKISVAKNELVPRGLHSPIRDEHPEGTSLTVRELLRFAVSESDGTASDVLLRLAGGGAKVTEYLRGLGVRGVIVETTEMAMSRGEMVQYRNWAQPVEMVGLLKTMQEGKGLSASSRDVLLDFMIHGPTGAKRLKGLLPAGTVVAHKTGTSGTSQGSTCATNDVGILTLPDGRHVAIAVFVSDSRASEAVREGVIAKMAGAAWDYWGGGRITQR